MAPSLSIFSETFIELLIHSLKFFFVRHSLSIEIVLNKEQLGQAHPQLILDILIIVNHDNTTPAVLLANVPTNNLSSLLY